MIPVALGVLAFGVAYWILDSVAFVSRIPGSLEASAQFHLWKILFSLFVGASVAAATPLWRSFHEFRKRSPGHGRSWLLAPVVISVASMLGLYAFNSGNLYECGVSYECFQNPPSRVHAAMAAAYLFGFAGLILPVIMGTSLIVAELDEIGSRLRSRSRQELARILDLKERLELHSVLLGVATAGVTLLANMWRVAVVGTCECTRKSFPPEYVVLFGLYGTLMAAIALGPGYIALQGVGRLVPRHLMPASTSRRTVEVVGGAQETGRTSRGWTRLLGRDQDLPVDSRPPPWRRAIDARSWEVAFAECLLPRAYRRCARTGRSSALAVTF